MPQLYRDQKRNEGMSITSDTELLEILVQDMGCNNGKTYGTFKLSYPEGSTQILIESNQGPFHITPDVSVQVMGVRYNASRGARMELSVKYSVSEGYTMGKISRRQHTSQIF